MESILDSIKKLLGISDEEHHFDSDIVTHINSVFVTLNQLGVGKGTSFSILDNTTVWNDFIEEDADFNNVKTYMYLKVKLLFDPPLNSSVMSAMERQISELEWRLNVSASLKEKEEESNGNE